MQNWLQRAAIWITWGALLYTLGLGFEDLRLWLGLVLLYLMEYLSSRWGARLGADAVLSLKQDRLLRLKTLFNRAAAGQSVDKDEVQRIMRGD